MKDGGVTEQRGSLVLYTCTESGLRAWSLGSWSLDCGVWDKVMVGALKKKLSREHDKPLAALLPTLAALRVSVSAQLRSTIL